MLQNPEIRLAFDGKAILKELETTFEIEIEQYRFRCHNLKSPGIRAVFELLIGEGASEHTLMAQIRDEPLEHSRRLNVMLHRVMAVKICRKFYADGVLLAVSHPLQAPENTRIFHPKKNYKVSRFASMRHENNRLILESPCSHRQIVVHHPAVAALFAAVSTAQDVENIASREVSLAFQDLLVEAGMLLPVDDSGQTDEDEPPLQDWHFHDLLCHTRSRDWAIALESVPEANSDLPLAVKPAMSDNLIKLHKPDMEQLKKKDISFSRVLEERRSIREYGSQPITPEQLGEFLYRSARIQENLPGEPYEGSLRPYPGSGALHTLEIYVVAGECGDLSWRTYHYCPQHHHLETLPVKHLHQRELLRNAVFLTGNTTQKPQVLLLITSRFQRLLWKYGAMSLSLILKDVGGLFQTMYLVATAMNLAPCALGTGNSQLFALATHPNRYEEATVGEFLLGSKPEYP